MTQTETLPDLLKRLEPKMSEANVEIVTHQKWRDIWYRYVNLNTRRADDMWKSMVSMKAFTQINKSSYRVNYDVIEKIVLDGNIEYCPPTEENAIDNEAVEDLKKYGVTP